MEHSRTPRSSEGGATGLLPSEADYLAWFDTLSNWGRWGPDDQVGTLNLISDEKVVEAAGLVRDGSRVSLGRVLDPAHPDELGRGSILHRYMEHHEVGPRMSGYREYIAAVPHGSATHLDALSHIAWKGKMYNGTPAASLSSTAGATKLSVHEVVTGITTRGVLLDVPAAKGVDWLGAGEAVFPHDLEAAEELQGVRVGAGDALLLYTGNSERTEALGPAEKGGASGYSAACLPWLHERGVAMISSDGINDVQPSGFDDVDLPLPLHTVAIVAMGLWLVDNMLLSELSKVCARQRRWEFLFTMSTLRFVGATSSLVNPVAIF